MRISSARNCGHPTVAGRLPGLLAVCLENGDGDGQPVYLNMSAAGSARRSRELMQLAAGSEINSFVIDIQDAAGRVSHRSQVPLTNEIGATVRATISDLHQLLTELEARRIYPIVRIVVVKDPRPRWSARAFPASSPTAGRRSCVLQSEWAGCRMSSTMRHRRDPRYQCR